jgi:hypothetical protein
MPTLISNENYAIRWDKTDCDQYTITNLSDQYNAHVAITDETGTYTEEFDLAPSGTNTIVLPGDGVFKLCAYLFDMPINPEEINTLNGCLSVCELNDNVGSFINAVFVNTITSATTVLSLVGDFSNPPTSYQSVITALQLFINANGGGTVVILEPGQSLPNVPADNVNYQIVTQTNNLWLEAIKTYSGVLFPIPPEDLFVTDSDLYCLYEYQLTEEKPYISSLIIYGDEIVPTSTFFDLSTQTGADAAEIIINTYLGNDGYVISNILSLNVYINNSSPKNVCGQVEVTVVELGPGETQCDYIYEFCDMYACLSRLMNRWLCQDPCADKCTAAGESYEEARRKAVELSTMFFHALMPLVTTDRLWYLGNWDISDQRLCNVNNILELYKKMRDYVKNCGFDCGCGCPDKCGDCQPCNGYSYAPSPSNPSTPCGCK